MSFNRGMKRNSGGGSLGNRSFGNSGVGGGNRNIGVGSAFGGMGGGPVSRGMSPWESGSMPGRGILPTPNNNLSINSPQAELVIVSNLLNNLIRTQQDTQPQVPSLLSLGGSMNGPGTNFRGQQNLGGSGRFTDRQMRQGNLKNQRPQPYNKMGNRARDGVAGRRGPSSAQQSRAQSQSGNQRINGNHNQRRNDKNSKANASKQNQANKKEQQDLKKDNAKPDNETIVKSEPVEENKVAEDTTGTDDAEKKPADASDKNETEDKSADSSAKKVDDKDGSGKKSEARHAESRYAAVPIGQMLCQVCNKHMWDGFSFENHLRGRAHQLMMEKLDESYKLKVDLMRHELRVSEEQREMSLTNSKRRGKKVSVDLNVREYCTMCDLNFFGTLSNHRKSEKHQQLKTFLHPRCVPCVKEFPSRIEYDEHCLTPAHMAHAAKTDEAKKTKKSKIPKGESEVRTAGDEEKDTVQDGKINEKDEVLSENTEYLTEILEEMDLTKYKIPSYKYCRQKHLGVGASLVKEIQGFHCEKCRRFMLTTEDMEAHLRTLTHYRNFVNEVKVLTTPAPVAETAVVENPEKAAEEETVEAKRQKLDESVTEDEKNKTVDGQDMIKDEKNDSQCENEMEDDKQVDESEKYDPMEDENDYEGEEAQGDSQNDNTDKTHDETSNTWGEADEEENDVPNDDVNDDLNDSIDDPKETAEAAKVDNDASKVRSEAPQVTNQAPQVANETSKITNQAPQVANETPKVVNEAPKVVNEAPKMTDASPKVTNDSPKAPVITPKVATVVTVEKEKVPDTPKNIDDDIPPPPPAPIISVQTPQSNKSSANNSPRTPNTPMHTPGKSPRGGRGGFRGNRGHQRARRSRR